MALDGVPWFVGGGAEHSPEVARLLAYAAMGGESGVIAPSSFKVQALAVPGKGVDVLPGAASIESLAAGNAQQTYLARGATSTFVGLSDTTSAGARSDLIYVSIEDPFLGGETWPIPSDVAAGPYVHLRVLEGVPSTTRKLQDVPGYSTRTGYAIARVDRGPSTGTVTNQNIVDLRRLARPRSSSVFRQAKNALDPAPGARNALTSSTLVRWPDVATWDVEVPAWATHLVARASVEQYVVKTGGTTGVNLIRLGAGSTTVDGETTSFDENGSSNAYRSSIAMGADLPIPAALRGKVTKIELFGRRSENVGFIDADKYTTALLQATFEERAG